MAGKPKKQALIHALTKRAADEVEDGTAHLEYLVKWIEDGNTLLELANALSDDSSIEFSSMYVTRYFGDTYPETYGPAVAAARAAGAFSMLDKARGIIDDAPTDDKVKLAKAKHRADIRVWTAERFNRRELGAPRDQASVTININSLHLDALRTRNTARLAGRQAVSVTAPSSAFLSDGAATVADEPADVAYEVIDEG